MAKPAIATKVNLALKLFTALGRDDEEEAPHLFKSASLDHTSMHILKANIFFDSWEWYSKDKLQIILITGSYCNGRIGLTSISLSRIDWFSGKKSFTIASRCKAQVHILPHYLYIQEVPKSMSGFFATTKLPSDILGGHVTGLFEAHYNDPNRPKFTGLNPGQWKFLFNSWKEDIIENLSPISIQ